VGLWVEVEYLLDELIESELPLQESVLISVINVCRSQQQQAQQGQWSSTNRNAAAEQEVDDSSISLWSHATDTEKQAVTKSQVQWARALWLVQRYGLKTGLFQAPMSNLHAFMCRYMCALRVCHALTVV
jgi:hypothetical protein